MTTIWTVGHSTHAADDFIKLLNGADITAIADVRSSPYSRHNPQFNRETLRTKLRQEGIDYVFLGDGLGARSDDPRHYDGNRVVYARLAQSAPFQAAIDRVIAGTKKYNVALMCAEKDPLTCHRTILVARDLTDRGIAVRHIGADGEIETHDEALERLMKMLNMNPDDMYTPREASIRAAYHEQELRIAYVRPAEPRS
ncbi:MAG: DUF488 domain-containing protein [Sphingomonas bacterium]|nr:DUF488 domain-containing protein [Sphingomonas bacterium]